MVRKNRQNRSARLTETTATNWDRFCTRRGVTYTAMIEALGERLGEEGWIPEEAVERARAIDRERLSRR